MAIFVIHDVFQHCFDVVLVASYSDEVRIVFVYFHSWLVLFHSEVGLRRMMLSKSFI